jgi:Spermine/spermidine synthase domain
MTTPTPRQMRWQMFALSFAALFLEMMVIRWVPSVVKLIAFYANLMLLSSFLGLGAGAMMARKPKWQWFEYFPLFLALEIGTLFLCRNVVFSTSAGEIRMAILNATVSSNLVLIAVFGVNALLFVPLGQRMGVLFDGMPRLSAYGWDLAGGLAGTLCFALFSLLHFSPVWGMAAVMAIYLLLSPQRRWLASVPVFAMTLVVVQVSSDPNAIWSPYHYITVNRSDTPGVTESAPPPDLFTMKNPPVYSVSVHTFYYHYNLSLDPSRYTPGSPTAKLTGAISQYFRFPYALTPGRDRALVLGAGGGGDIQGALASGVRHVDAVEIDPQVVAVSRRFNPDRPYFDPRVTVHVDDARSFLAKAQRGYDVVVYGLLDSHALFSSMSNVRLDGYVYTVEGLRRAFDLLADDGMLVLAFYIEKDWLLPKLHQLVSEATGRTPAMYVLNHTFILCAPKKAGSAFPASVFQLQRSVLTDAPAGVEVPTDDWPFLYLRNRTIPFDYVIAIASLLVISVGSLATLRRGSFGTDDLHFALLGMGFLLLETKSITDCSLYFGATWLVTVVVVTGVLLMVMASNLVAMRIKDFSPWMYAPLFASLLLLLMVPRELVLGLPLPGRLFWAMVVVPLPVFFAGLIFSTTFRLAAVPSAAFGANLIGAMVGGFCEYLAMAVGSWRLSLLIVAAYLVSMLVVLARRRQTAGLGGVGLQTCTT